MKETAAPEPKPIKVLYVEDEVLIALDGEAMLREMGFEHTTVAISFVAAEAAIRNRTFDLAILDINLGGGQTSLPLVDQLLASGAKILFASSYNAAEGLIEHLNAPMIQKPFDERELRVALLKLLGWAAE